MDHFVATLKIINANQGILILVFTFLLVWFNLRLAKETKRLREVETEPHIEVYLLPYRGGINIINMIVRNSGGGPARDVKWDIRADIDDLRRHNTKIADMTLFKILHYLPAKETIEFYFGSAMDILKHPKLKPFEVVVTYNNNQGKNERHDAFKIDIEPFEGMHKLGTPPDFEAAKALKQIAEDFHRVATGFSKLKVITKTEEEERKDIEEWMRGAEQQAQNSESGAEPSNGGLESHPC